MGRYIRNTAILAKIESSYGVDSTPTEGANAMLVSNVNINPLAAQNVPRDLIRPYMGGSEQLVGNAYVEMSFDVELQGSGTAGTAPAYDPLLQACGFAASATGAVRANYYPETPADGSCAIYYFIDGVKHVVLGCRGNMALKMGSGQRPVMSFKMLGIDTTFSAASPSALTLTGFKTPSVITDPNTGDLTFGCTFNVDALAPALTSGTAYSSRGIELDLGNAVAHTPLLGGQSIDISAREVTGKIALDLTAAQEVTFMTAVKANTVQSIGLVHGTTAGYKVLVFMPAVQLINPSREDMNGRVLCGYDIRAVPSAGNDDIRLVTF
jgi:hypothetical protein